MSVFRLFCAGLAALACTQLPGWAVEKEAVGKGDFPALQFLPPGSVVEGISLPRYEGHRVSTLLMAEKLEVLSRTSARLTQIRSYLTSETGETTCVQLPLAYYDFTRKLMRSLDPPALLIHPRYSARGEGVIFNNAKGCGLLIGPVTTSFFSPESRRPGS